MLLKLHEPPQASGLREAVRAVDSLLVALTARRLPESADDLLSKVWPHAKPAALKAGVGHVMALSRPNRVALLEAFRCDAAFSDSIDNDLFAFAVPSLPPTVRDAASVLLRATYEVLTGSGFVAGDAKLTAMSVLEGFFAENPEVTICPACLRANLERPVGGKRLNDLEHFFPKSRYPSLAVHHHNLVPICMACNERVHGSLDPLKGPAPRLSDTYVPYVRPAIDELVVVFVPAVRVPEVRLKGRSPAAERRLRAFDRLYRLEERWSEALQVAHNKIRARMILVAKPLERPQVEKALRDEARRLRVEVTMTTDALLEAEYCEWLADHSLGSFLTELRR